MRINSLSFELPESFFQTQRILKNISAGLDTWSKINKDFSYAKNLVSGLGTATSAFSAGIKSNVPIGINKDLLVGVSSIQSVVSSIQLPKVINIIPSLKGILPIVTPVVEINRSTPVVDWDWIEEALSKYDDDSIKGEVEDILTEELSEELRESVNESLSSDDSDKVVKSKFLEWQKRHPVLAYLFLTVIVSLLISIVSSLITNWISGVLIKKSNIYEEPTSKSSVVMNVDVNQNVTIVNSVPYYYEVMYIDPDSGEEKTGYLYKPNVIVDQETSEENVVNEDR